MNQIVVTWFRRYYKIDVLSGDVLDGVRDRTATLLISFSFLLEPRILLQLHQNRPRISNCDRSSSIHQRAERAAGLNKSKCHVTRDRM